MRLAFRMTCAFSRAVCAPVMDLVIPLVPGELIVSHLLNNAEETSFRTPGVLCWTFLRGNRDQGSASLPRRFSSRPQRDGELRVLTSAESWTRASVAQVVSGK